jgi:hypothetical protein
MTLLALQQSYAAWIIRLGSLTLIEMPVGRWVGRDRPTANHSTHGEAGSKGSLGSNVLNKAI